MSGPRDWLCELAPGPEPPTASRPGKSISCSAEGSARSRATGTLMLGHFIFLEPEQLTHRALRVFAVGGQGSAHGGLVATLSQDLGRGSRSPALKKAIIKCGSRASSRNIKPELVGQWTCYQKVLDLIKTADVSAGGCGSPLCCCWELRGTPGRRAGDWVRRARTAALGGSDPFLRGQNGGRKRLPGVGAEDSRACWLGSFHSLRNVVWLFRLVWLACVGLGELTVPCHPSS